MSVRRTLLALACAALPLAAGATDLLEVWRAASAHDPEFAAARASRAAGESRREQAGALWRPNVSLVAGAAYATQESATRGASFSAPGFGQSNGVSFDTSVNGGTSTRYAFAVRQPLYDRERDAASQQLRLGADMASQEWRGAEQQLMVRAAERYFDAALAAQQLRLLGEQEQAVDKARVEAEDRFRIGDRPVTDVHEATARAAALRAQRLAADSELEMRRALLADFMGAPPDAFLPLPASGDTAAALEPLDTWLARAASESPQVLLAEAQLRIAQEEARKSAGPVGPTLDLVAQVGRDQISGSGDFGSASQSSAQRSIGVQLTLPIYTGGMRGARHTETEALVEKGLAERDRARQQVAQQTRAAWLAISVGRGRIAALHSGWRASLSRLDATRTGVQAGDRTTLDLLNAQNDAAAAELALLQARAQQLVQRLRLAAVAGVLDESQLAEANAQLDRARKAPQGN